MSDDRRNFWFDHVDEYSRRLEICVDLKAHKVLHVKLAGDSDSFLPDAWFKGHFGDGLLEAGQEAWESEHGCPTPDYRDTDQGMSDAFENNERAAMLRYGS